MCMQSYWIQNDNIIICTLSQKLSAISMHENAFSALMHGCILVLTTLLKAGHGADHSKIYSLHMLDK